MRGKNDNKPAQPLAGERERREKREEKKGANRSPKKTTPPRLAPFWRERGKRKKEPIAVQRKQPENCDFARGTPAAAAF